MTDPIPHVNWARRLARAVARRFGFGLDYQETADLEQTALAELCAMAARFDPAQVPAGGDLGRAFQGFAAAHIRGRCVRAAWQLRNGGTYRTTRQPAGAPKRARGREADLNALSAADIAERSVELNVPLTPARVVVILPGGPP